MKRSEFLKLSGLVSGSLLVPGFLQAFTEKQRLFQGKRIVFVQLSGGNDGLNTLVPFRNDIYYKLRPKLALPSDKLLKINDEAGFHPAMEGFRRLFDEGQLSIFNGVGYPNPDRSHFRSTDIWHTASASDEYLNTGWLGRLLDAECKGSENPWYALEVDDTLSLALKGARKSGFAMKDAGRLKSLMQDPMFEHLAERRMDAQANSEQAFLYKTLRETRSAAAYLVEKSAAKPSSRMYPQHDLGNALRQIASLISAGMESGIYYTGLSGFDTHVRQAETQQRLLNILSDSIAAFAEDLKAAGEWQNTVVVVFSEFGRRVKQNASNGTDHGTANNVYVLGGGLKNPGMRNPLVSLSDLDDNDLRHTIDFRELYASLLDQAFEFDHQKILGRKFNTWPLV